MLGEVIDCRLETVGARFCYPNMTKRNLWLMPAKYSFDTLFTMLISPYPCVHYDELI